MTANNHQPVFPTLERGGNGPELTDPGMSLRDYFAAQALAGGLEQGRREDMDCGWWHDAGVIANRAYAIADAMLKAQRKK